MGNYSEAKKTSIRLDSEAKQMTKCFGERLAKLRKKANLYQEDLAHMIGKENGQTISNWETGNYPPKSLADAMKLADVLHCDLDYLIGRLPEQTHDIQFIHDQTGLTGEAVKKLQENRGLSFVLSLLIEQPDFVALLHRINQLLGTYMLHPPDPEDDDDLYIREEQEFATYKHLIRVLEAIPQNDYLERMSDATKNYYPVEGFEET